MRQDQDVYHTSASRRGTEGITVEQFLNFMRSIDPRPDIQPDHSSSVAPYTPPPACGEYDPWSDDPG